MRFDPTFVRKLEGWLLRVRGHLAAGPAGRRPSRHPGAGYEFADSRPYASGDDFRHVDWLAYARLELLRVRRFHEEAEVEVLLAIDASASMGLGEPSRLDAGCRLAAVLGGVALASGEPVRLAVLRDGRARMRPPLRGRGAWTALLEALDGLDAAGGTDLARSLTELLGPGSRPRLCILCSDFLDPAGFQRALEVLSRRTAAAQVVQVIDDRPASPAATGERELIDRETGERLALNLDDAAWTTRSAARARRAAELAHRCRAAGLGHLRLSLPLEPDEALLARLAAAGVVG